MVYKIKIDALTDIGIGKELDSGTLKVIFDVSNWQKAYPELEHYHIEVSAPNGIIYIPANVMLENSQLIWLITDADTAMDGKGAYQIVATGSDGKRKTSDSRSLYVGKIIDGTDAADPPEPSKPWVDAVLDAAKRAEEAAERAENAGGGSGGGITQETDPTVPAWAKQPNKPAYTAEEVGAQPKGEYALKSEIPSVPVQSVNGKTGNVQLTATDVGAASKTEVDKLSEEIENLKTPGTEVTVSTTGDMIVINPGAGNEIAVTGNTDADEVKIVHCGDNLIDISSAKNIAGESVYDNGWIVIKRSEADAETTSYAQCLIPLTPAMQPGKKYNLYVEISDDTNCVGVWTLAMGQKNAAEALNTQVGGLSYKNGAGVYVAPVKTKDVFPSSVVCAMRHIITWQAGAHGTIKYRPWYTVADPETVIPDGNSPFSTSAVKYAEYNGAIYTKMLPTGHSGAYEFDSLTAFAGNNTIIVSNGTVTASYSEVVSDDRVGNPLYRKRIAVLGDSISTINYTRPNYWEMIAEKTGCLFDNYATSNSRFANVEGDAVESFVERIEHMDDTADAVLVMGGTNDAGHETILGTWNSNDESTFYGAMSTVISLLRTKYPGKPIVFCTPIRRNTVYDSADIFPITLSDLKQADETKPISMKQVALAIKAKCSSNGIPVIDLFDCSGIGYGCAEYFRENDILHPSAKGHVRIANMVHAELEKQFMHNVD